MFSISLRGTCSPNNLSHGLLQYLVSSRTDARKGWVHLKIRNNAELSSTRITILPE